MQVGETPYLALLETVKIEGAKMSLDLLNTKTQVHLQLSLTGLKGNMARLRVTETEPVRPRYEPPVGDVLVHEPPQQA